MAKRKTISAMRADVRAGKSGAPYKLRKTLLAKAPKGMRADGKRVWADSKRYADRSTPVEIEDLELFSAITKEEAGEENVYFHGIIDGTRINNLYIKLYEDDFDDVTGPLQKKVRKMRKNSKRSAPRRRNPARGNMPIPPGAHIIYGHEGDTVAYYYTSARNKPAMLTFKGKSKKPYSRYQYKKESDRTRALYNFMLKIEKDRKAKSERAKKRKSGPTKLKTGDILYSSWGYDQTNIDFYVVTAVSPSKMSIKIAEVEGQRTPTGDMTGDVVPARPIKWTSKESGWKKPDAEGDVKVDYRQWAREWDGKPQSYSSYA